MQLTVTFKVPREPYLVFFSAVLNHDDVILSIGHFRAYPRLFESSIDIVFVARSNTLLAVFFDPQCTYSCLTQTQISADCMHRERSI